MQVNWLALNSASVAVKGFTEQQQKLGSETGNHTAVISDN